jgi:hypothetical protein
MGGGSDGESPLPYAQRKTPRDTQYLIQMDEIQFVLCAGRKAKASNAVAS